MLCAVRLLNETINSYLVGLVDKFMRIIWTGGSDLQTEAP